MKIYKSAVFFADDQSGSIYHMDTIEYQGKFWLVPMWLESPSEGISMPARIVSLETLQHQKLLRSPTGDFCVNQPISKDVLDGLKTEAGYVVIEKPNIRILIPKGIH